MGYSKNICKREVYSNSILPQETRKILNKPHDLAPKTTREKQTNKHKQKNKEKKTNISANKASQKRLTS